MIVLALIVSGCIITLVVLVGIALQLVVRSEQLSDSSHQEVRSALLSIASDLDLPRQAVAQGISDADDLHYVMSVAPQLRREFSADRMRLARLWLRENSHQLRRLMRLHRLITRHSRDLQVSTELKVMGGYLTLALILLIAEVLVVIAGPFRARSVGLLAVDLFDHLSCTIGSAIVPLDAARRASIRDGWAHINNV